MKITQHSGLRLRVSTRHNYTNPTITMKLHTYSPPQSRCSIEFLDNSHISEAALELHSRAAPSVGGITAQSVQPRRNPGGRQKRKKV